MMITLDGAVWWALGRFESAPEGAPEDTFESEYTPGAGRVHAVVSP
jgi:hypothetical protein